MNVTIEQAIYEQKPAIRNLMHLYIYDFSEFMGWHVGENGLYDDYRYLDHYWTEEGRFPFLIRADGKLAGFALVRQVDGDAGPETHMAEFFVMRAYRKGGVGSEVARRLFRQFPGRWKLDVMPQNAAAPSFWRRSVTEASGGIFAEGIDERGKTWFAFEIAQR